MSLVAQTTNTEPVERAPQNHRTIDRVTQILEEVVYNPGVTFAELARALDAPKSSVHGFIRACWRPAGCTRRITGSTWDRRCTG
jgi:hypothetical protein